MKLTKAKSMFGQTISSSLVSRSKKGSIQSASSINTNIMMEQFEVLGGMSINSALNSIRKNATVFLKFIAFFDYICPFLCMIMIK